MLTGVALDLAALIAVCLLFREHLACLQLASMVFIVAGVVVLTGIAAESRRLIDRKATKASRNEGVP